ncbi:Sucrose nonfermenting 4-like protein, partial [Camellia lanceoleosa]
FQNCCDLPRFEARRCVAVSFPSVFVGVKSSLCAVSSVAIGGSSVTSFMDIFEYSHSGANYGEVMGSGSGAGSFLKVVANNFDVLAGYLSLSLYLLYPNSIDTETRNFVIVMNLEVAKEDWRHPLIKYFINANEKGLAVVPIWDSNRRQISGMLTASDFILILMELLMHLHRNHATLTDEQLEVHTISAWKEGKSQQYGEAFRDAQLMFGRPLIWAGPDESLKDVALMILQNKISTVPIIYSTIEESCPLLLHITCLSGILKCGWLCQVI